MAMADSKLMITAGRWLLALYFLVPGIMKFMAWDLSIELMTDHGIPSPAPLLLIAGAVNIVGALLLFTNRFVRFTSLGFVVYILIINATLHNFWALDGIEASHELQNFIKNLGILAGLLVLAGISPKRALRPSGLLVSDARA